MPAQFDAWIVGDPPDTVVHVAGELDIASAPILTAVLDSARAKGASRLAVDCTALTFCDVTGVSALLSAAGQVSGGLELRSPPSTLRRIREILGLHAELPGD